MSKFKYLLYSSALLMFVSACKKEEDDGSNPTNSNLPLVNILSPLESARSQPREVFIQAEVSASGNKSITKVEFSADGDLLPGGELTSPPYQLQWTVSSGFGFPREIVVKAYDNKGFTNSDTVSLTVWNGEELAVRSVPRYAFSTEVVNDKLYVIGGYNDAETAFKLLEEYDPETDTWSTKASSNFGHAGHTSCVINDKIYVFGGDKGQNWHAGAEVYDPATDIWSPIDSIPLDTNVGRGLQASAVLNGQAYIFGGEASPLPTVTGVYNATTDDWTLGAIKHVFNASAITLNSNIYLIGGCPERAVGICESPSGTVEIYDPVNMTFTARADMNHARFGHSTCVHNGKIYVFGGSSGSDNGLVEAEVYDPVTDEWTELTTLPEDQMNFGCVTIGSTIYIISSGATAYAYYPD